jgi:ubiquinone/menaquinone biosynthesis C-methylase UbiE
MAFDLRAVAHAYGSRAVEYAEEFGDDLSEIHFDRAVVERALVGLRQPARVLDIGCGPGQVSAFVEARGDLAVALDVTFEMLIVARRRQAASAFTCADIRWIPCADASFAAALCWYSLHHLPRLALPAVLEEIRRVTYPGGRLAIGTHGGEGEKWHDTDWDGQSERVL